MGRGFLIAAGVVAALSVGGFLFLALWKPFGGTASREARADYASRAANFDGKKFHNEDTGFAMMVRHPGADPDSFSDKATRPDFEFPVREPDFRKDPEARLDAEKCAVTWFGHSSVLLQMHGMNILFDPVFSEVISPVPFVGSRRFSHPTVTPEELPPIDVLILSHDHYDHLDYDVIRRIDAKVARYVVPLGVENHLVRWGVSAGKITDMAWWEETEIGGLTVACTPAQHFSGRTLSDQSATLWASWVLRDGTRQVFESGDSGFHTHFERIHERYGDFDFAMIECGQYDKRWAQVHMFPEESVRAARILGARTVLPIHWGALVLANHGWDDPVERFLRAAEDAPLTVITPLIGQTADIDTTAPYLERWWRRE